MVILGENVLAQETRQQRYFLCNLLALRVGMNEIGGMMGAPLVRDVTDDEPRILLPSP